MAWRTAPFCLRAFLKGHKKALRKIFCRALFQGILFFRRRARLSFASRLRLTQKILSGVPVPREAVAQAAP
jgi:hypothetical protein